MRPYLRLPFAAATTLLCVLLVVSPTFAQEAAEAPAEEAAAEQVPSEGTLPGEAAAEAAVPEEPPPVEMEAPEREVPRGLEEIVVTAEKREASLQETPVAISAFTAEKMKDLGIRNANDYTTLVPSLSFRVSPNRLFIRGVGRTDNSLGLDPGVAMYTDGVYTSETAAMYSSSFGTERLEILRGPQGTLYGRNTTGGAVNFISAKPEDEYHFEGRVRIGNFGTREYALITTGPILTDRVRFHILASDASSDATQKNYTGRDPGDNENRFYRVQLEADLTEDLTLWLLWDSSRWSYHGTAWPGLTPYAQVQGDALTFWPMNGFPGPRPGQFNIHRVDLDTVNNIRLNDTYAIRGSLTWDAGSVIAKYLYGFQTYDWNLRHSDADGTPRMDGNQIDAFGAPVFQPGVNESYLYNREDKQFYSHELTLSSDTDDRLQWIAGLYYYNERIEQPWLVYRPFQSNMQTLCISCGVGGWDLWNLTEFAPNVSLHNGPWPGPWYDQQGNLKSEAHAAYGELYYDIDERFKLTAGARYSYDRKHSLETQDYNVDALFFGVNYEAWFGIPNCCAWVGQRASRRLRDDWRNVSGRLVLDFMPNDDTLAYFSIAQGYKAGGFRLASLTSADPSFDPEQVLAFELGYKATVAQRFRVNAAAFYYDYKDQHVLRSFQDPAGFIHASVINADKTIVYGLELETEAMVTDELTLMANYSYNHGRFRDFCCSLDESFPSLGNQDLKGNDVPQMPEHKVTLGATYNFFTDIGIFGLTSRWSWVDKQSYDIFENAWAPSYHRLDYFLSYRDPADRWTVIGYVKNATDEQNFSSVELSNALQGNNLTGFPNLPRTFGVEVLFRF